MEKIVTAEMIKNSKLDRYSPVKLENCLAKGDYETAEKELLNAEYISLAAHMWLKQNKPDRALQVFDKADERGINYHRAEKGSVKRYIKYQMGKNIEDKMKE